MTETVGLALVVIRVADIDRSAAFYAALGLHLVEEQHGQGPRHYSTLMGNTVLELYPASSKFPVTSLRLGFTVDSIDTVLKRWQRIGYTSATTKSQQQNNRLAVSDPDGHHVELTQP